DFISDELIHFLRYETKDMALADRVEQMKKSDAGLAAILVTILKSVDYYSISQIDKISEILSTLDSQNVYERLRSRADTYLDRKRYFKAIDCYKQIIKEYKNDAPGAFTARIYHNTGVAYAGMFMYDKAAESFKLAYETGQYSESYDAYLAAKYFDERNKELIVEDVSDRELAVRKRIEGVMDNARYQEEYRKLEELVKRKEHGDVAYYHKAVKDILSSWKDEYRGYSARDN
ncbi:MAG: tetratricopeptide repeat protein, partial [Lachnospira sp.]|nr:tetratricopeptide repeat protein [Lachnospira sp.]